MPADLELGAAITVEDTSELDGLTADVAPQGGDGGGATGGAMGGGGGIMDMLGQMTGLLKIATVALSVLMAVPGLISGVMRLLEVALLPIGVLFQSLLAPLIQRLLKWLVQNDIIGMVQRFAQKIVTAITNFIAGLQPLIDGVKSLTDSASETAENIGESTVEGVDTALIPARNAIENVMDVQEARSDVASGNTDEGLNKLSEVFFDILNPVSELSSTSRDSFVGEASSSQTQEEGPS